MTSKADDGPRPLLRHVDHRDSRTPASGNRYLRAMDMHLHMHDGLHALIREAAEEDGVSVEAAVVTAVEDFVASRRTRGVPEHARETVEQDAELLRRPAE